MLSLYTFTTPPAPCAYLPDRVTRLKYEVVAAVGPAEYAGRMLAGWRRFGYSLFTPDCPSCTACRSLRVDVPRFAPSDSQKRCWRQNHGSVTVTVGSPEVTAEKLALYDAFQAHGAEAKGWPDRGPKPADEYAEMFVENPFPVEEWCYRLAGKLVGVGYVDALPVGPSAVYFYHDPAERKRSLGTFNVLSVIDRARRDGLPHAYLGLYVAGCRSLAYKANYRPHEVLTGGEWRAGGD